MNNFGLSEEIILNIVKILEKYPEVVSAKIFGSRARGDYKSTSDIDIALFGDNITNTINTKIFYDIEELYLPYKVDLITLNTLREDNLLRENILKEGVEIYAQ